MLNKLKKEIIKYKILSTDTIINKQFDPKVYEISIKF